VFKAAIMSNSHALIVAHNHPAGSLTPSDEDLQTTRQLIKAGELMNIPILDHIIVAASGIPQHSALSPFCLT
jgi:DNA repair protein RadC